MDTAKLQAQDCNREMIKHPRIQSYDCAAGAGASNAGAVASGAAKTAGDNAGGDNAADPVSSIAGCDLI